MSDALPIAPSHLAHPWHGISPGAQAPVVLTVYIEIVPTDTVKYEVDKLSGHLRVDRPQKFSALCPALYGFVPRTLCGDAVGAFAASRAGRPDVAGDGDPMDVCVLTEREINRGGIIVTARPIGGFRMFDGSEADDKILAVLEGDAAYGGFRDLGDCPPPSWSASATISSRTRTCRAPSRATPRSPTCTAPPRPARSCATRSRTTGAASRAPAPDGRRRARGLAAGPPWPHGSGVAPGAARTRTCG